MKKIFAFLLIASLFSFNEERKYTLTHGEAVLLFSAMETAKKAIPVSEAVSAKEATVALAAIDSVQKVIYRQYSDTAKGKGK